MKTFLNLFSRKQIINTLKELIFLFILFMLFFISIHVFGGNSENYVFGVYG